MSELTTHRVRLPLRTPIRGVTHRDVTLVHGPAGWGEASPFPGYPVSQGSCEAAAVEAATASFPAPVRGSVPVNALVGDDEPSVAAAVAAAAVADGVRTLKVKVGDQLEIDRVAAVRDAVGAGVAIRVDANGAWGLDEAIEQINRLARFGVELIEEPVSGLEALSRVRRAVQTPIAADESVRSIDDAIELRRKSAADVLVLKVQACGGVGPAMDWADAAGVPVIVSSMIESSVGLAAGVALAASLPRLDHACGLGTAALLGGDVTATPLVPRDGEVEVRRVTPDVELLSRYGVAA